MFSETNMASKSKAAQSAYPPRETNGPGKQLFTDPPNILSTPEKVPRDEQPLSPLGNTLRIAKSPLTGQSFVLPPPRGNKLYIYYCHSSPLDPISDFQAWGYHTTLSKK